MLLACFLAVKLLEILFMKRSEYTQDNFSWTQWTMEDIARESQDMLDAKKIAYNNVKSIEEDRTFENTIYAIEASNHVFWKMHAMYLLMNVSPSKEIRDAAQNAIETIEKALVDIEYDEDIYAAVKAYASKGDSLDGESKKLFQDMLRDYRRMGFELSLENRERVKENLKRLSELSSSFQKNINEYQDGILVTREELEGLSEKYIANLEREGDLYKVSLDYPELNPFLEQAVHTEKRKELAEKSLRKGGEENMSLLAEVVRLREENAKLLGYENHAAFQLEVKMAKDPEAVFSFINGLMEPLKDGVSREVGELLDLKKKIYPEEENKLYFYDIAFLSNELKKEKFSVDNALVQEYFPLDTVKRGMFDIYETLLSIRFERIDDVSLWHPDVETYSVRELNGDIIAYFLLDLHPRDGKYGHAAVFTVVPGHQETFSGDEYVTPVASMVANFPKPNGSNPSLLTHYEVVTFFHEFGHVMHDVLSKTRFMSQSGTSVARDFVEAPSQMLEYWMWEKEVLKKLSRHYKTGEILPDEIIDNMIQAKHHMKSYSSMRQMIFALFDMNMHTYGVQRDLNHEYADLVSQYTHIELPKTQMFAAGFGHLMGYDAGYYGYMWSKVYAADMYSCFQAEGILNPVIGMRYRENILERGSSRDEMESVEAFLGRKSNNQAFLKEMGL